MATLLKKEDLHPNLLMKCQECAYGGQNVFPDGIDFDPTQSCEYFNDITDEDPREPDYKCEAYVHMNTYVELKNFIKSCTYHLDPKTLKYLHFILIQLILGTL